MAKAGRKPEIDLDGIRDALASAECMVRYYGEGIPKKLAENAAMEAAGLAPIHKGLQWDRDELAKKERQADALRAVLAYFEAAIEKAA